MTTHVERSIEVNVPVSTVYNQWTQFEDFPRFMGGVQQVRQVGDTLTHWVAEIAGVRREWDAEIVEQVPDQKVAWAATTGATNAGAVFFDAVGADRTRVRLTLDYEPEGIVEKIGDVLDVVDRQAVADLDRFKQYIESRGAETGGWRGTVHEGAGAGVAGGPDDVTPGAGTARADGDVPASAGAQVAGPPEGDAVAVGPTGDTRSTLDTEAGPSRSGGAPHTPDLGRSGDPLVVDAQSPGHGRSADTADTADTERTGTAAGAAGSAGVTGFGTDTGMSSSPTSGVLTGDPGARAASHAGTGTGDLVGEVGSDRAGWTDQPGARDDVTEAVTDPVGEDWAGEPGAGSRNVASGADAPWAPGGSGPGEDRGTGDLAGEGVVERNYADESITTQDVVARDFDDRDVSGEGVVQRDFADRDITERDIANRGIVTGTGGAHVAPRTGTADDPDNPIRPSV